MKILQVGHNARYGGAARAMHRLYVGLNDVGVECEILVAQKHHEDTKIHTVPIRPRLKTRLNWVEALPYRLYPQREQREAWSVAWMPTRTASIANELQPDIVHLHWLGSGFLPIQALKRLNAPIVWTLHDSWAFTGGCHLPHDCRGYEGRCGNCPQLHAQRESDLSRWQWQWKQRHWRDLPLHIITPSQWLADAARASSILGGKAIQVIPNGIDTNLYQPQAKAEARQALGIPTNIPLVAFGAANFDNDHNKGWDLLQAALARLGSDVEIGLLVFGADDVRHDLSLPTYNIGRVDDEATMAQVYAAVDVFVIPSRSENLPFVVMEALACGTPCVGFAIGGIPDLITHHYNGYLAQAYAADDLAAGIGWVLGHDDPLQLGNHARESAMKYDIRTIAQQHVNLYQGLLR